MSALRAAFAAYGTDQVTWSTTWEDLFPKVRAEAHASLHQFYGPLYADGLPSLAAARNVVRRHKRIAGPVASVLCELSMGLVHGSSPFSMGLGVVDHPWTRVQW
jgi:hypothetical protein